MRVCFNNYCQKNFKKVVYYHFMGYYKNKILSKNTFYYSMLVTVFLKDSCRRLFLNGQKYLIVEAVTWYDIQSWWLCNFWQSTRYVHNNCKTIIVKVANCKLICLFKLFLLFCKPLYYLYFWILSNHFCTKFWDII